MDNNKNNEELFFKVFKNIFLKNKIFSFLQKNQINQKIDYNYHSTVTLELLAINNKYEIIYDKLKSHKQLIISKQGLKSFLNSYLYNPLFKESFELLWNQYDDLIKSINPLKIIIFQKHSLELFKYIYNNYYLNKSKNNTIINQTFILYDLMDKIFKSKKYMFDTNEVPQYIIEIIKNNKQNILNNNEINNNNIDNNKNYNKYSFSNELNSELIEYIYGDKIGLKIPIFLKNNFQYLKYSTNEKIKLLNHSGINIAELIKNQFDNSSNFENKQRKYLIEEIDYYNKEKLEYFYFLNIYGNQNIQQNLDKIPIDSTIFLKILLLKRVKENNFIQNYQEFKDFFIENQYKCNSLIEIIKLVRKFQFKKTTSSTSSTSSISSKATLEELFYYFDSYLIYYYIQKEKIEKIEKILNLSLELEQFNIEQKIKENVRKRSIGLLFYYSFQILSIEWFNLSLKYGLKLNFNGLKFIFNQDFSSIKSTKNQIKIENVMEFYNKVFSNKNEEFLFGVESLNIMPIIKNLIGEQSGQILELVLNCYENINEIYTSLITNSPDKMFYLHFKSAESDKEDALDLKKIQLFITKLSSIDQNIQHNSDNYDEDDEDDDELKKLQVNPKHIGKLLNHLLNNTNLSNPQIVKLAFDLQNDSKYLDVEGTINIFNQIDQPYNKLLYTNQNQIKSELIPSFYLYKSNILIYNLFLSILKKDIKSIYKVLNTLKNCENLNSTNENNKRIRNNQEEEEEFNKRNKNSSNNYSLQNELINNNNNIYEIIKIIQLNGYFKYFDLEYILECIIIYFKPSKEFFLSLIPSSETELLEIYNEYYGNTIQLYYHLQDYENQENETTQKYDSMCQELESFINDGSESNPVNIDIFIEDSEDENPQIINKATIPKSIESLFLNRNYPIVLGRIKNNFIDIKFNEKFSHFLKCITDFSIDWFKKLYRFISIYLEDFETLIYILFNNNYEIFEYIWDNELKQLNKKKDFINSIFGRLDDISASTSFLQFILYFLKSKTQFFLSHPLLFNNEEINSFSKISLVSGNMEIFLQLKSIFNHDLKFYSSFLWNSHLGNGCYCSQVIEYFYQKEINFISILGTEFSKLVYSENGLMCLRKNYTSIPKSSFILFHTIIKLELDKKKILKN